METENNPIRLAAQVADIVAEFTDLTPRIIDQSNYRGETWVMSGAVGHGDAVRVSDSLRGLFQGYPVKEARESDPFTTWTLPGIGTVSIQFRHDPDDFMSGCLIVTFQYDRI